MKANLNSLLLACVLLSGTWAEGFKIDIHYNAILGKVELTIPAQSNAVYEVYRLNDSRDLSPRTKRWKLADRFLKADRGVVNWGEKPPPDQNFAIYAMGRGDLDANENALPDAREAFIDHYRHPEESMVKWTRAGLSRTLSFAAGTNNVMDYGAVGDGIADDTKAILAAIDSVPEFGVVYLPPGRYRLTSRLFLKSNMILRGAGAYQTKLLFEGSSTSGQCIGVNRWNSSQTYSFHALTSGVQKGESRIYLEDVSDFQVGDVIEVKRENDPKWGFENSWQDSLIGQLTRVKDVNGPAGELVLDRPLRHDYEVEFSPAVRKLVTIGNVGIEDLYIAKKTAVDGYTIEMKYAENCWIRGVESYNTYKSHVWMSYGFENEVSDSYFHHAHVYGGGGQGYGVGCGRHTSDCLIENNIFIHLRHSMIVGIGANGNVYGYNYSAERAVDPTYGTPQPDISVHGNYVYYNLFEGNVLEDADMPDWYHPAGPGNLLFRNRVSNSGTAVEIASDHQMVLGNDLPDGQITVDASVKTAVLHGNKEKSITSWSEGESEQLPDSFMHVTRPHYYSDDQLSLPWPGIGPQADEGVFFNAAHKRYASGDYIP